MSNSTMRPLPPDQPERVRALDAEKNVLVKAPAGSGKTNLLTRRFLRLLSMVDEPGEIVAITFTKAAAAEMRHRILAELERAAPGASDETDETPEGEIAMSRLAEKALERSEEAGWKLIDLPAQLRIMTIDAFCRELALQQPLLSGLGGGLEIAEHPQELYRRAARRTLNAIGSADADLPEAIEALLLWRDNSWQDVESQLVEMLAGRDRWMRELVLDREPDWEKLRARLERPFARAVREALTTLSIMLDTAPGTREEILELSRFACAQCGGAAHQALAELADFPMAPFEGAEELESARESFQCLAALLLTGNGTIRRKVDKTLGFPVDRKPEKARMMALIGQLGALEGFEAALCEARDLPPSRYTDEDWRIVQACFTVLRRASGELKVVFAETGTADYTEVAQIAAEVLKGDEGIPSEGALAAADKIKHLLVDEFQDTSRKQHRLLEKLIAAWPTREGRTCFVVGDPMQSIYLFREADAELFGRVERLGLEIEDDQPLEFEAVHLTANFRTEPELVMTLNAKFDEIFRIDDGSGVRFARAEAARKPEDNYPAWASDQSPRMDLHVEFMPASKSGQRSNEERERVKDDREAAQEKQTAQIVELIEAHCERIVAVRQRNAENSDGKKERYRVAVLGRTKKALAGVASALRESSVPFRAVDLEQLKDRPEVMDALALGRALLNAEDRVAWLGVLRAPWCGLALEDLHALTSSDDEELIRRPVPELMKERVELLSADGAARVERLVRALSQPPAARFARPTTQLGTWLEQVWLRVGGAACVDSVERANLDLLWRTLDGLPEGEQDFLGAALDAALEKLHSSPDPGADADCGVQLMTIHASKGLEFEVVIVPELQAGSGRGEYKMLAWMERGVLEPEEAEEPTELLIAPFQEKGAERGKAKTWVDHVHHERERQEVRRILYVAATRAREELHLFSKAEYKQGADGFVLSEPRESLLKTAWPAIWVEIEQQFAAWKAEQEGSVEELAAQAANVIEMPLREEPETGDRRLGPRRLPAGWTPAEGEAAGRATDTPITGTGRSYERHEGGLLSRAMGRAVHLLLEQAALLREERGWDAVRAALEALRPRVTAEIRAAGIERNEAARIAERALAIAVEATEDESGRWILEPREEAQSEVRWAEVASGALWTVQADRVFKAGEAPLSVSGNVWWIVDYKTAYEENVELANLRREFAPQLETYARVLRNLRGTDAKVCAGLYYPRMRKLDWWEIG